MRLKPSRLSRRLVRRLVEECKVPLYLPDDCCIVRRQWAVVNNHIGGTCAWQWELRESDGLPPRIGKGDDQREIHIGSCVSATELVKRETLYALKDDADYGPGTLFVI